MSLAQQIKKAQEGGYSYFRVSPTRYELDEPIIISKENFTLDMKGVSLESKGSAISILNNHVTILGGRLHSSSKNGTGITIAKSTDFTIRDVDLYHYENGMYLSEAWRGTIDNVNVRSNFKTGIFLTTTVNSVSIVNSHIRQNMLSGIYAEGWGDTIRIQNCTIEGNRRTGILTKRRSSSQRRYFIVEGCHFEKNGGDGGKRHIDIHYADGICIRGNFFHNSGDIYARGSGFITQNWVNDCEIDTEGAIQVHNIPAQGAHIKYIS